MFTFSNEVFENKSQFDNSGSRPTLGLNKARLEKVEYSTSDKGSFVEMHFLVGTTPMNTRIYNITKVFVNKNEINVENVKSEEERKALSKETSKIASAFYQLITCYIPAEEAQQQLQEFQQQVGTFTLETLVKAFNKLVPFEMYSDVDIDVFCVHQKKLTDDGKEYLTIQSTPYPGETIFTKHMGEYTEHLTEETKAGKPVKTLVYLNSEGKEHPIKKGNWFLTSEHTGWLSKLKTVSSSSPLLGSIPNATTPEQAESQIKNIFG